MRGSLYTLARMLGHLNAIGRGPGAIVRRVLRVAVGREIGRRFLRW